MYELERDPDLLLAVIKRLLVYHARKNRDEQFKNRYL